MEASTELTIKYKDFKGEDHEIKIDKFDQIEKIKLRILKEITERDPEPKLDFSSYPVRIEHEKKPLCDFSQVSDYEIKDDDTLELKEGDPIQVFLKTMIGDEIVIKIEPDYSGSDLKTIVENAILVPKNNLYLIC